MDIKKGVANMEMWKDIPGYEGEYKVSNYGNVKSFKSKKPKMLTWHQSKLTKRHPEPMYHIELWNNNKRKTFKVHRLVAQAFIPNAEGKPQINHKDGDRRNNHVSNLEWVTGSENMVHAYGTGLTKPRNRKPIKCRNLITNKVIEFESTYEASRNLGLNPDAIRSALKGRTQTSGGYEWEYI